MLGCKRHGLSNICVCVCVCMYFIAIPKKETKQQAGWPRATEMVTGQHIVLGTGTRGTLLSQALENDTRHLQDLLSHLQELGNIPDR
jgi:preprotein translocase subunit YajC